MSHEEHAERHGAAQSGSAKQSVQPEQRNLFHRDLADIVAMSTRLLI